VIAIGNALERLNQERVILATLIVVALAMTLKYFPGLENSASYAGNVFQAIYPDAFPRDPNIGADRSFLEKPFQISLFYLLPKMMGEIWLDDRFVAVVYFGLVLASVLGIDRIVRLLGGDDLYLRLLAQLFFMRDHHFLTNTMSFAHQADANHAAFAIPVHIWLIYSALARKRLWVLLALSVLLAAISVKNAPYTIAYTLIIAAVFGTRNERALIAGIFTAALFAFYIGVVHILPVPEADRVVVFDLVLHMQHYIDANPFYLVNPDFIGAIIKNVVFFGLCLAALFLPGPDNTPIKALRIFVGCGLGIWLLGGLYYSFTPDALKLPHIAPFSLVRNLRWPEAMAYVTILVCLFHWLRARPGPWPVVATLLGTGAMMAIGRGNPMMWGGVCLGAIGVVTALGYWRSTHLATGRSLGTPDWTDLARRSPAWLVVALSLVMISAYPTSIAKRFDAWKTLVAHGVMGDTGSAQWIGVDDYIRNNTPADAVILPLQYESRHPGKLKVKRYFATRTGRATPIFNQYSSIFDLAGWRQEKAQRARMTRVEKAIRDEDLPRAVSLIKSLALRPDYIILPSALLDDGLSLPGWQTEAEIQQFTILKRAGYS
jgi:hypothetical protein